MSDSTENNARKRWNGRRSLVLLGVAFVPLLIVGWVALPTIQFGLLRHEIGKLDERAQEAAVVRKRVEQADVRAKAVGYECIAEDLRALIPLDAAPFEIFHSMRNAAVSSGFRLDSAQIGSARDLGWNHGERAVRATEVHVVGTGSAQSFIGLVDGVRSSGRPVGVRSLDLAPREDPTTGFDVIAVLETYWSAEVDVTESDEEEPVE